MSPKKKRAKTGKKTARSREKAAPKKAVAEKPSESTIPLYDSRGREIGRFELKKELFDGAVNRDILYQVMTMYCANQRQGTASTKTRSDVSGGGRKPWRQKGTGRARAGSSRSPLWRGGGVVFGPHPRDFHYDLPRKVKARGLLSGLNSKLNDGRFFGIDAIEIDEPKTKRFRAVLEALMLKGKSLFILADDMNEKILRASRNLQEVAIKNIGNFNTADVLRCDNLVMSRAALEKLPERFSCL
jgi:large subunit ribosomal protein L4